MTTNKVNFNGQKETAIKNAVREMLAQWAVARQLPEDVEINPEDITRIGNNEYAVYLGDIDIDGAAVEVCGKLTISALEYQDKTFEKKAPVYAFERLVEGDNYEAEVAEKAEKAAARKATAEKNKAKREAEAKAMKAKREAERAERAANRVQITDKSEETEE